MRMAFVVLAHTAPAQVRRLLRRLATMGRVYVHIDRGVDPRPFAVDAPAEVEWVRPRVRVRWGCISVVWATLNALQCALREDPAYVHLLSGLDYPLVDPEAVRDLLMAQRGREFIDLVERPQERARYQRFHFDQDVRWRFVRRPLERVCNLVGAPRMPPLDVAFGSGWWTVSGALAQYFVEYCARRRDVMRYFRHTLVPDEMLFQSIALQSPFRDRVAGHNLHFVDFGETAHPRILTRDDLPLLRASGRVFARKFGESTSAALLDALDSTGELGHGCN